MNVLILGDGLLGSEVRRQTGWDIASRKLNTLNLNDLEGLKALIANYSVVLNCIANTNSYSLDENAHREVNYKFVTRLVSICNNLSVKLVHISTEFVYANNKPLAKEEDLPQPDNTWYAFTKMLADEYIKLKSNDFLICRESHKPYPFPYPEVWDVKTSGDTVDKISKIIVTLIKLKAKGVFNVGTGTKNLSEIAPNSKIIQPPPNVPRDTTMDLTKLNDFLRINELDL